MRLMRMFLWTGGFVALLSGTSPAGAAWNNVFQVCCLGCKSHPPATSNYYAAYPAYGGYTAAYPAYAGYTAAYPSDPGCCPQPCPQPCPQRVCETRYEQRTYYQQEVHYETRTAYDPVTTYTKSYFWEPVTSYRVSSYYDPSSCCARQVTVPCTSYRLREQCCPVQSWVARCYQVPVTTLKPYTRCEPVTSCYWTNAGSAAPSYPMPAAGGQPGAGVNDNRPPANAGSGAGVNDNGYQPQGYRQFPPAGNNPKPATPVRPDTFVQAPPAVQLERIAPLSAANVEGVVIRSDNTPDSGVRLTFRRADRENETHTVTADSSGRFKATLASGGWVVCTQRADGQLVPHTRIDVREDKTSEVKLTSR